MRFYHCFATILPLLLGADFGSIDPSVIPKDDPRAKELPRILATDQKRRMQVANERESKAFAAVSTKAEWEAFKGMRIAALRESLGKFPEPPAAMKTRVTGTIAGDGFKIDNVVYETRPGLWVSANLYSPITPLPKMPGILISHAHHTPKEQGELQDMGMTWARAGCVVLVPDHLGHGERRQHDFRTEKDYPQPFRTSRQDYYFRYNAALQLELAGESLMGWMVWDLMRGVDLLLKQPGIDRDRIILLGAVAGGGDPAGVTAALDDRIAAVAPFNFGGVQPDYTTPANTDRDFYWFSEGYWETTRCLRDGAAGGFAHWVIVGSIAPRKLIYSHEFDWKETNDPAWPRIQKAFDFYSAKDHLRIAHGTGSLKGNSPTDSHCTHIGPIHRKGIHAALQEWFKMPVPMEYSKRRSTAELTCWTDEAKQELKPKLLHEVLKERVVPVGDSPWLNERGTFELAMPRKEKEGEREKVPGGTLTRIAVETEVGIVVPCLLLEPESATGKLPVVLMFAQAGKAAFLAKRSEAIAALLKSGVAVCLVDVRGTGETRISESNPSRGSSRTSVSQGEWILGQSVLSSQLRDLRTVVDHLKSRPNLDRTRVAVWGDSFAEPNRDDRAAAVPYDVNTPRMAEPGAALLALLAGQSIPEVRAVYAAGGLASFRSAFDSPYLALPHDAVLPGIISKGDVDELIARQVRKPIRLEAMVSARNVSLTKTQVDLPRARAAYRTSNAETSLVIEVDRDPVRAAEWIAAELKKK